MADELDALLERIPDIGLRSELLDQIRRLRRKRTFGLVFESHLPERVRLPDHPIRRGSRVVDRDAPPSESPQEVLRVSGKTVIVDRGDGTNDELAREPLVVVAEFGEPVYPGLANIGSIYQGGGKPTQVVIKGENYHTLEALRFSHASKIDCIYIDPPYNTGARDWKYDNDYVDSEDEYRHSKWLAFMERRLRLARDLLNPDDSILIVTIDEKEVHRLALLLEQLFPDSKSQMVTIVTNAPGQARRHELARVEEHAFFLFFGEAEPALVVDDLLNDEPSTSPKRVRWESLLRSGTNSRRDDRPALFYPVFVDAAATRIVEIGDSKPRESIQDDWEVPPGTVAVWPLKNDGSEGNWRASPEYLRKLLSEGYARLGSYREEEGRGTVWYLGKSTIKKIQDGQVEVIGRDEQNAVVVGYSDEVANSRRTTAKTVWNRSAHHAGWHGSALVRALIPGRSFPFPKSLYSVEDALRIAVGEKPNATILDFFAGSGTTAHAVFRLNRQDGGQRQSITVTNNEVSADEAKRLRKEGIRPGDEEWEGEGIFEHVTKPRLMAAITGRTPQGSPVDGEYKFTDEFPIADGFPENLEFFQLKYLDIDDVELDQAFESIAPLLWLRSGGVGPVIARRRGDHGEMKSFDMTDLYGVLFDPDQWRGFVRGLPDTVTTAFIVTDSPSAFASVASELPMGVEAVRLYENYLSTFAINRGQ